VWCERARWRSWRAPEQVAARRLESRLRDAELASDLGGRRRVAERERAAVGLGAVERGEEERRRLDELGQRPRRPEAQVEPAVVALLHHVRRHDVARPRRVAAAVRDLVEEDEARPAARQHARVEAERRPRAHLDHERVARDHLELWLRAAARRVFLLGEEILEI